MAGRKCLVIFCVLHILAIVLSTIGAPIAFMRSKEKDATTGAHRCMTLWGVKSDCSDFRMYQTTRHYFAACGRNRRNRFVASQGAAMAGIGLSTLALLLALPQLTCCRPLRSGADTLGSGFFRWSSVVCSMFACACFGVTWIMYADSFWTRRGPRGVPACAATRFEWDLSEGFALYILAFVTTLFTMVLPLIPK